MFDNEVNIGKNGGRRREEREPAFQALPETPPVRSEHVILLHGLCRTRASMKRMATALSREGYIVWNVGYPSRTSSIESLSEDSVGAAVEACRGAGAEVVHFVTHSLGGILVRSYLARHRFQSLGRVVMLGPPNGGSEVVDRLGSWRIFCLVNGPAGTELGTGESSTPNRLGPATFDLGVIAGCRSINPINSRFIAGPDDGKVSVARTRLTGMEDHVVIPASHPFLMRNREAIRQTVNFLRHGRFVEPPDAKRPLRYPGTGQ